jgi:DNA-binding response OmpR family regulator
MEKQDSKEVKTRILLVEDDQNLGFVIKDNLEIQGYEVVLCGDGEVALSEFSSQAFDICVLDVMLPKKDGISSAQEIRTINQNIPIIFLSAKSMKEDKIAGFRAGADDYVTKPFSIEELILRIEVFLKRSKGVAFNDPLIYKLNNYTFDYNNLLLSSNQNKYSLTKKEADVLKLFSLNKGKILKREEILKGVWGDDDYFMGRSMDVFISRLRNYLKDDPSIEIQNIHGIGFKLVLNI